ncbi:MAG: signal peptidase I [Candidatus Limivivens sp.]|nr:signal peptidase I [Candidatus Limivivens sp.]
MREILGMLAYLTALLLLAYLVLHYIGQRTTVSGMSMYPTLEDGDNLIVDKISYRFRDPQRYDIIVFPFQYKENTYYIKRIIGLPGETVRIVDGKMTINGELLNEDYGYEIMESPGLAQEAITLGEDEYFVLGDNRNNSMDSREPAVGTIKRKDIIGRAFLRIWPLSDFGILKHQ